MSQSHNKLAVRVSAVDAMLDVVYLLAAVVRPVVGVLSREFDRCCATDGNVVLVSGKRE